MAHFIFLIISDQFIVGVDLFLGHILYFPALSFRPFCCSSYCLSECQKMQFYFYLRSTQDSQTAQRPIANPARGNPAAADERELMDTLHQHDSNVTIKLKDGLSVDNMHRL